MNKEVISVAELVALATGGSSIVRDLKPGQYNIRLRDVESFGSATKVAPGVWIGANDNGAYLAFTISVRTGGADREDTIFFRHATYEGKAYFRGLTKFIKGICNSADVDFDSKEAFYEYALNNDIVAYFGYDEYVDKNEKVCRKAGWNADNNFTTVDVAPAIVTEQGESKEECPF